MRKAVLAAVVVGAALAGGVLFAPASAASPRIAAASAPLDRAHSAVRSIIENGDDAAGCRPDQKRELLANASIRKLGRIGGDDVVLAVVYGACICGAQNCPYYALRLTPGKPDVLMTAFGIDARTVRGAGPLPGLVIGAHDSAMVIEETTYAYRDGKYVGVASARVRASDRARKTDIPVRFAAGASSAELRGTISNGWYDIYTFDAAKGQRLTIDGVRSKARVTVTLYGPKNAEPVTVRAGLFTTLSRSGSYRLQIDNDSEDDVPYALSLVIR
jgi:hypothetical protein